MPLSASKDHFRAVSAEKVLRGVYGTVESLKRGRKAVLLCALARGSRRGRDRVFMIFSTCVCKVKESVRAVFPGLKGSIVIREAALLRIPLAADHESVLWALAGGPGTLVPSPFLH